MTFYLFAGEYYYPEGGAKDFIVKSEGIDELRTRRDAYPAEVNPDNNGWGDSGAWWQITDDDMTIIEEGEYPDTFEVKILGR